MSPNIVEFFSKYIERETGIIFQDINMYQLKTRIEDIVKYEKLNTPEELMAKFQTSWVEPGIKQRFLDHATNNETLFFRDPTFFTALESYLMQEVVLNFPNDIKIWSAAASTGQEALSIAMTLDELSQKVPLPPITILATDISEKAIAKAKSGLYTDFEVMRGLSEERKNKYFNKVADGWQVKQSLQSKIKYGINNLIKSTVNDHFHVIFCRNVLIYQKVETKKIVVDALFRQLDPQGAILLGVGETMLGISDNVQTLMVGNVLFYRKKNQF